MIRLVKYRTAAVLINRITTSVPTHNLQISPNLGKKLVKFEFLLPDNNILSKIAEQIAVKLADDLFFFCSSHLFFNDLLFKMTHFSNNLVHFCFFAAEIAFFFYQKSTIST